MCKKKVVYIAQSAGGVAQYLKILLNNIENDLFENYLIVSNDYLTEIEDFKNIKKENIYFVDMIRNINIKSDINAIIKVRKIINKIKPDVVYMNSSKAGAIGRLALLFKNKIKKIYNAHGWYFNANISKKKKFIFATIENVLAIVNTNIIVDISQSEYDSSTKKYKIGSPTKHIIIENAIETQKYIDASIYRDALRKKYNINNDEIVVGVVGRLSNQKDPMTSIKVAENLILKNNKIKFMFVGDGELKDEVIAYAKEKNIDKNIIITGWVKDTEKYISAFDIAMLPSKYEGFGLVIVEYMASGKPVVASNVGGIANIINTKEKGYLCTSNDVQAFTNSIEEIIENFNRKDNWLLSNISYVKEKYDVKRIVKDTVRIL